MRLLHYCGLPVEDVDFINSDGKTMNKILLEVCVFSELTSLIVSTCFTYFCNFLCKANPRINTLHW